MSEEKWTDWVPLDGETDHVEDCRCEGRHDAQVAMIDGVKSFRWKANDQCPGYPVKENV